MQQQELGGGRQSFAFNHLDERDFKPGLRPYARYRDLGFAAASGGVATAQVIRMTPRAPTRFGSGTRTASSSRWCTC